MREREKMKGEASKGLRRSQLKLLPVLAESNEPMRPLRGVKINRAHCDTPRRSHQPKKDENERGIKKNLVEGETTRATRTK